MFDGSNFKVSSYITIVFSFAFIRSGLHSSLPLFFVGLLVGCWLCFRVVATNLPL